MPLWSFLAVAVPLVLTPGASTAVVVRNSIGGGMRAGVATAAGVNGGSVVYGLASAFGLALALRSWPSVWIALRWGGGLYLLWLAIRALRAAIDSPAAPVIGRGGTGGRRLFPQVKEGFLTNLLNPSIASFYLIVMPQFVPRGAPVARSLLILTAVHVSLALSWHLTWAAAGGTLSRALARGPARRALDLITCAALLYLAVRVMTDSGGVKSL